jgi:HSP20 family protein
MNYFTTNSLSSLLDEVFFKDFFKDELYNPVPSVKKINYPVDIYETDKGLNIDIAAIGLDKTDIKIEVKDDVLEVSYTPCTKGEIKTGYRGITQKAFDFAWKVNDKFDLTKVEAELEKGLLKITAPPVPEKQPTEIEIKIK